MSCIGMFPDPLRDLIIHELEALIKKMEPGGSAGYREEEEYVC